MQGRRRGSGCRRGSGHLLLSLKRARARAAPAHSSPVSQFSGQATHSSKRGSTQRALSPLAHLLLPRARAFLPPTRRSSHDAQGLQRLRDGRRRLHRCARCSAAPRRDALATRPPLFADVLLQRVRRATAPARARGAAPARSAARHGARAARRASRRRRRSAPPAGRRRAVSAVGYCAGGDGAPPRAPAACAAAQRSAAPPQRSAAPHRPPRVPRASRRAAAHWGKKKEHAVGSPPQLSPSSPLRPHARRPPRRQPHLPVAAGARLPGDHHRQPGKLLRAGFRAHDGAGGRRRAPHALCQVRPAGSAAHDQALQRGEVRRRGALRRRVRGGCAACACFAACLRGGARLEPPRLYLLTLPFLSLLLLPASYPHPHPLLLPSHPTSPPPPPKKKL